MHCGDQSKLWSESKGEEGPGEDLEEALWTFSSKCQGQAQMYGPDQRDSMLFFRRHSESRNPPENQSYVFSAAQTITPHSASSFYTRRLVLHTRHKVPPLGNRG